MAGYTMAGYITARYITAGYITTGIIMAAYITPGYITGGYITAGHIMASCKRKRPYLDPCETQITSAYRVRKLSARSTRRIPWAWSKHIISEKQNQMTYIHIYMYMYVLKKEQRRSEGGRRN